MSLLERVIAAHKCRSMHHHIALDALSLLEGSDALKWKELLLRYNNALFQGAKAPDAKFRDFQNHVLHVSEGGWGGAKDAAMEWYAKSVEALSRKNWEKAAYSLGVMSHYYADVCQPFHTGQTEEEGAVHRAIEWSIFKSAEKIQERIVQTGYPTIARPKGAGFVGEMVQTAAEASHSYYDLFIDHYNIDAGVEDPTRGPDETLLEAAATCFAYATAGVAILFSAAIKEAAVEAPKTHLKLRGYLAYIGIPERKILKKLDNRSDRRQVQRMYRELKKTGKVIKALPADDSAIRKLHARFILRKPLKELNAEPIRELGTKHLPLIEDVEKPAVKEETPKSPFKSVDKQKNIPAKAAVAAKPVDAKTVDILIEPEAISKASVVPETPTEPAQTIQVIAPTPVEPDNVFEVEAPIETVAEINAEPEVVAESEFPSKAEVETEDLISLDISTDVPFEFVNEDPDAVEEISMAEAVSDSGEVDIDLLDDAELDAHLEELIALDAGKAEDASAMAETQAIEDAEFVAAKEAVENNRTREGQLGFDSPIVDAPSIGKKTAKRFNKIGISTVEDLIDCDIQSTVKKLDARHIDEQTLIDWQDQTMLKMEVPSLRTLDVQILVGAGIRSANALTEANASDVFSAAMNFLNSEDGTRVSRNVQGPIDESLVDQWIDKALYDAA